ncbi:MAG: transglycosylase domain-containing protein [Pyrinomonadaceae bacterium]
MQKSPKIRKRTVASNRSLRSAPRKTATKQKQRRSVFGRVFYFFVNGYTLSIAAILLITAFLFGTYFWFDYSQQIDQLISGEVFTHSAGVYSAPKTLRTGEKTSKDALIAYLRSAGYIAKERKASGERSRFEESENSLLIEPGTSTTIDGEVPFKNLKIDFSKDGTSVSKISLTEGEKAIKSAQLEPVLLSSVASEGNGTRKAVRYNDLPVNLINAITVTEDRAFFEHYGVNFRGIARALWHRYENPEGGSPLDNQGGSSITQQLIKNLFLSPEVSLERKAKEAFMSIILETKLSKKEIFTLYANQIYLGQTNGASIYGVGEASNIYFGKDVSALTLPECAFLAGIIRSPNRYNAWKNPERVKKRRNQVLISMVEAKAISAKMSEEARSADLELNKSVEQHDQQGMQYFAQYASDQVPKLMDNTEALQHSRVYTSLDPDLQRVAHRVLTNRIARLEKSFKADRRKQLNAALVAIKPETGEIVAMIGGKNYLENQFNRATDAKRQPGSVFKPFVYAAALDTANQTSSRVITPATIFKDEKKTFNFNNETYSPNNYGDYFSDQDITVRDALVKSKNTITVDLAMELNIGRVMNLASKAGLPKVERAFPSMALGTSEATPLEMATAYTTFANLGKKSSPISVTRITDGNGRTVLTPTTESKKVLRDDVAYIMDDMMKDVMNRGTAAQIREWGFKNVEGKRGYAGKTGTSRDGWFAGFTPHLVCVVYVGFDDGSDLNMKGSDSAMPIWADFMREALRLNPQWEGDWTLPPSIQMAEIDIRNGEVIRELSQKEAAEVKTLGKPAEVRIENENSIEPLDVTTTMTQAYLSSVPPEFRRVELFLNGTVPAKSFGPVDEKVDDLPVEPVATPTPFTTWEQAEEKQAKPGGGRSQEIKSITLMICPVLGMRAGPYCPHPETRTFKKGEEPKRVCTFHQYPENP